MFRFTIFIFVTLTLLFGCTEVTSTDVLDADIVQLDEVISEAKAKATSYSGGLLASLTNVRLEALQSTRAILDQKRTGLNRFIPVAYNVDGNAYRPPENKEELQKELRKEIDELYSDLAEAKIAVAIYDGGLLGVLASTKVATIENSIAFVRQKHLLLQHDIPYYALVPTLPQDGAAEFKATPGTDIEKF